MIVLFYFVLHPNRLPSRAHATATPSPISRRFLSSKCYTVAAGRYADSRERHKCHQLGRRWVQRHRNPTSSADTVTITPPLCLSFSGWHRATNISLPLTSLGCGASSYLACYLLLCRLVSLFVALVLPRIQGANTLGQGDMVTTKRKYAFNASIINAHRLQADPP